MRLKAALFYQKSLSSFLTRPYTKNIVITITITITIMITMTITTMTIIIVTITITITTIRLTITIITIMLIIGSPRQEAHETEDAGQHHRTIEVRDDLSYDPKVRYY